MRIGLGMDTGGTYTDAVLIDRDSNTPLHWAKSPTTREDLSIGIAGALCQLPADMLKNAEMVSLSTTLATNACVEDKGGRAAVLLLGYDPRLIKRLAGDYGLSESQLPILKGSHGQRGQIVEEPDYEEIRKLGAALAPSLDAIGISEYWGVRNPEFEQKAKEILLAETGLPVAAAHELTGEINSLKRAATTMLNARLIPITTELMRAVRAILTQYGIGARMMIVRGDGALMSEAYALEHPVETLLSGPAASVAGGIALSGRRNCLVVDIGGTTTDIAVVRNSRAALTDKGVQVGSWRTGTKAVAVRTIGLGGDTRLHIDGNGVLSLDVRRVMPLCQLASQYPGCIDVLQEIQKDEITRGYSKAEFLILVKEPASTEISTEESRILEALRNGPLSVEALSARIGTRAYFLRTERLEGLGILLRGALALTDLWHITGEFTRFDAAASRLGAQILAERVGTTAEALMEKAFALAQERLYRLLASHLIERANPRIDPDEAMTMGFFGLGDEIELSLTSKLPLVGIGAPTDRLLPGAAHRLGTEFVSPNCAGVGGAAGAITGPILREARVLIRPLYEAWGVDGYACHAPGEQAEFEEYEEALAWSRKAAERAAIENAKAMGAQDIVCELSNRESIGRSGGKEAVSMLLETEIIALASGRA